ncbi:MAG: sterol desaturase/sphingolipid hydroxylase (fatty acid hydroxylase superfamily), partial [Polaribacter sp.]
MAFFENLLAEAQRVIMENPMPELMVYGGPVFIGLIVLEIIFSLKYNPTLYKWKDLATSGTMGVGAAVLAGGAKIFSLVLFSIVYIIFNPENEEGIRTNIIGGWAVFGFGVWYIWVICQVLDDFSYYMVHRANHKVRFLWAAHIVHHSSDHFNLGTAVRNGWVTLFYKPFFYMW